MNVINLKNEVDKVSDLYVYEKIGFLNEHILSVVNVENRSLDFYVIEGSFILETENEKFGVNTGEMIIVPKGVRHRPVVDKLTKFLMIELSGTLNKENSGSLYEE